MRIGVLELKRRIDELPVSVDGRRRYTGELKQVVVEHVERRCAEGTTAAAACRELGIHKATLVGWMKATGRRKKGPASKRRQSSPAARMRAVQLTESKHDSALVVLLPGGARVEGLSIAQLGELAKALA
jgi:transposase-like protein